MRKPFPARVRNHAFTLVEMLLVLVIIGVLASILLPAISRAKFSARNVVCKGNLRQLAVALNVYASAHETYPLSYAGGSALPTLQFTRPNYWWDFLGLPGTAAVGYNGSTDLPGVFRCPFQKPVKIRVLSGPAFTVSTNEVLPATSYGYNAWGTSDSTRSLGLGGRAETSGGALSPTREAAVTLPVDMVAFGDGFYRDSAPRDPRQLTTWQAILSPWHRDEMTSQPTFKAHRGKLNRAFCDGHIETFDMNQPFRREPAELRRWNRDALPHPETWR